MNTNSFFKTALFLDRDGIINSDFGYVYQKEKLELVDGIIELIDFFSHELDHIIVVSNQSGIGRGLYSNEDWEIFNQEIQIQLNNKGVKIDKFYCCPHLPHISPNKGCDCRKPNSGMLLTAQKDFSLNLEKSILVGDNISDIQAARNAGLLRAYLLTNDNFDFSHHFGNLEACNVRSLRNITAIEIMKRRGVLN